MLWFENRFLWIHNSRMWAGVNKVQHCVSDEVWNNLQHHLNLPRQGRRRYRCQVDPDVINDILFFLFRSVWKAPPFHIFSAHDPKY
jgi:hypothetical protein